MRDRGRLLLRLTDALSLTRLRDAVIQPAVADMQHECALAKPGAGRAFALARGYWSIVAGCAFYAALLPARHLRENWAGLDAPGPRLLRQASFPAVIVAALGYGYVGFQIATTTTDEWRVPMGAAPLLLAAMLVMATPAALSVGVGWVLARDRSGASATILIGALGACFSFAVWEVVVTRGLDTYLQAHATDPKKWQIRKGSEMTFMDLGAAVAAAETETRPLSRCSCSNGTATLLRMEWHRRLSIPALAISFMILAVAASRTRRRLLVIATLWPTYIATVGYMQVSAQSAVRGGMSVPLALWGGHLLPLTIAAILLALTARRMKERVQMAGYLTD